LEIGSYFLPRQPGLQSSYFMLPTISGMTGAHHLLSFFLWRWDTFYIGCPGTATLPISASQVASIIRVSHWCQAYFSYS
jgi:hypothetical protein